MSKLHSALLAAVAGLAHVAVAGQLEVVSTPAGGAVFLDDRYLGVTPLSVELGAEGAHLLRIEKRRHAPWRGTVELRAEPVRVEATLTPETLGRISVTTDPEAADVYVDGRLIGKSPIVATGLTLTAHQVRSAKAGYSVAERDVDLSAEQPAAELQLTLTGRIEEYLVARVGAHPEDVMALTDLAHEYALRRQFDDCLDTLATAFDSVSTYGEELDQDAIRRVYQEVQRLHDKQFEYAPDDVIATLRPRLVEALRAAIERHPGNGYNYESLGGLLQTQGDADGALATYQAGAAAAEALPVRIRLLGSAGSAIYARAAAAEKAKDWQGAIAAYEEVVKAYPESWCAHNALSRICFVYANHLQDPGKALEAARRILDSFPDSPDGFTVLAGTAGGFISAKQHAQAAALYDEAAERYAWHYQATAMLAKAAALYEQQAQDPEKALASWRKLIDLDGSSAEGATARKHAADILRAQGDAAGADALVAEILQGFPLSVEATAVEADEQKRARNQAAAKAYREAPKLLKGGKQQEAADACTGLIEEFGDNYYSCLAQDYLTKIWRNAKDWEKVVAAHEQFAERWPGHADASEHLYQAAYVAHAQIGDLPRALEAYQRCADAHPDSYYAEQSLWQAAQLWMQSAQVIDYQKAMDAFLRLARDFPRSENAPTARKYAGDCQMQLRDPERAREMFLELMTEDPNSYAAYLAAAQGYQWVRMRKDAE